MFYIICNCLFIILKVLPNFIKIFLASSIRFLLPTKYIEYNRVCCVSVCVCLMCLIWSVCMCVVCVGVCDFGVPDVECMRVCMCVCVGVGVCVWFVWCGCACV